MGDLMVGRKVVVMVEMMVEPKGTSWVAKLVVNLVVKLADWMVVA